MTGTKVFFFITLALSKKNGTSIRSRKSCGTGKRPNIRHPRIPTVITAAALPCRGEIRSPADFHFVRPDAGGMAVAVQVVLPPSALLGAAVHVVEIRRVRWGIALP